RAFTTSSVDLRPSGTLEVLWSPNGEHSRQKLRRYSDRVLPSITIFAGNGRPQATQMSVFAARGTGLRGPLSGLYGRQSRQCFRPRKLHRRPSIRSSTGNSPPQIAHTSIGTDRT